MSEEQKLKIGDIVTHESDPETTGIITGQDLFGMFIIDYNISCPPTLCEERELTKITTTKERLAQSD